MKTDKRFLIFLSGEQIIFAGFITGLLTGILLSYIVTTL